VELQQEIRPPISNVPTFLEHSDKNVRRTAIDCLSSLAAQGIFSFLHHEAYVLSLIHSRITAGHPASNSRWPEIVAGSQSDCSQGLN
jgi:hypothetical protein